MKECLRTVKNYQCEYCGLSYEGFDAEERCKSHEIHCKMFMEREPHYLVGDIVVVNNSVYRNELFMINSIERNNRTFEFRYNCKMLNLDDLEDSKFNFCHTFQIEQIQLLIVKDRFFEDYKKLKEIKENISKEYNIKIYFDFSDKSLCLSVKKPIMREVSMRRLNV